MKFASENASNDISNAIQTSAKAVLVVDDSKAQRRILSVNLARWGYKVHEAASGAEALEICKSNDIDLVVSDWMMPGMSGLEFCQAFRTLRKDRHGYFILLTSNSEKAEIAQGLDVGADDFLTKPVAANEFRARIRAGERILKMERELVKKNQLINQTLSEISTLYDALDRDLIEARSLQQSLVRDRYRDFGAAQVSLLLRPSGHVGGDLVGFFPTSDTQFGLFAIDVSGHGVAAALMTARLAAYLSGSSADQNLALSTEKSGKIVAKSPATAAGVLNELIQKEMETEIYFTMILGHFDMTTGLATLVQCGHPNAAVQRADGSVEYFGEGGLPVGLIAGASWTDFTIQLAPGDRLMLLSDGIIECCGRDGEMLEEDGLADLLRRNASQHGSAFFETLVGDLTKFAGDKDFSDDVSGVLLEYSGTH